MKHSWNRNFAMQTEAGADHAIELVHSPRLVTETELLSTANQLKMVVQIPVPVAIYWPFRPAAPCLVDSSSVGHAWLVVGLHQGIHRHTCHADGDV